MSPCLSTPSGGVNAAYRDCAGCGCQEGRTHFHGRGFAGTVRANQCHNLAGVNVEGYIVDGGGVSEASRELACRKHRGGLVHSELHEVWESMGKSPAPEMMEINGARRDMPTLGARHGFGCRPTNLALWVEVCCRDQLFRYPVTVPVRWASWRTMIDMRHAPDFCE